MRLERLTKEQLSGIYNERMVIDFPPAELKPLFVILEAYDKGIYEGLGLYDGGEIVGYTYLLKQSTNYLVDYLAIYPDKRNTGVGTHLLRLLGEYMAGSGSIIAEVEDPSYAENGEERKLRERRISFYLRNGCRDTGVRVKCFGVPFLVLQMGEGIKDKEKYWEMYASLYRAVLPQDMYDDNIELLGYTDE